MFFFVFFEEICAWKFPIRTLEHIGVTKQKKHLCEVELHGMQSYLARNLF